VGGGNLWELTLTTELADRFTWTLGGGGCWAGAARHPVERPSGLRDMAKVELLLLFPLP